MKVMEAMSSELQGILADATVQEAAERMRILDVGSLPVVSPDQNRVVGILTDRDIVIRSVAGGHDVTRQTVREVMSRPLVCCRETDELEEASSTMKENKVRRVLVLNEKEQTVGILSLRDLAGSDIDSGELGSVVRRVTHP